MLTDGMHQFMYNDAWVNTTTTKRDRLHISCSSNTTAATNPAISITTNATAATATITPATATAAMPCGGFVLTGRHTLSFILD